jgi:hypothetical protein
VSDPRPERLARLADAHEAEADDLTFLFACLGSGEKRLQRPAADVLARFAVRDARIGARLRDALAAPEITLRWGAVYSLSRLGTRMPAEVLPVLLEVLGVADGDVRWAATAILLTMSAERDTAVAALYRLARDGNAEQRKMALYCLRDLDVRTPRAVECAHQALDDVEPGVRLAAMAALLRLSDRPEAAALAMTRLLRDDRPGVRRAAAATLGRLGVASSAVVAALRAVVEEGGDDILVRTARRALATLT